MKAAKQHLIVLMCFVVLKSLRCFFVNENALVACFDSGIDEALVKGLAGIEPLRVVYTAITALPLIRPRSIEATPSGRIYARLKQLGYQVKLFSLRLDSPELAAARIQQKRVTIIFPT